MSVQSSQASITRGQKAGYLVQVSTQNGGSGAAVSVALTAQPSSQQPVFTGGCDHGDGTATCTVGSMTDKQTVSLRAQIPVAADATSVTSVTLTATAGVPTTATWTPPSAAVTVAVASASAAPATSSASASPQTTVPQTTVPQTTVPQTTLPLTTLPLGPIPNVNPISSQLIHPGNAAVLFPAISPAASPTASPGTSPGASTPAVRTNPAPVTASSSLAFAQQGLSGQLAGLVALAVGILLTVTRLSLRKRFWPRKRGRLPPGGAGTGRDGGPPDIPGRELAD